MLGCSFSLQQTHDFFPVNFFWLECSIKFSSLSLTKWSLTSHDPNILKQLTYNSRYLKILEIAHLHAVIRRKFWWPVLVRWGWGFLVSIRWRNVRKMAADLRETDPGHTHLHFRVSGSFVDGQNHVCCAFTTEPHFHSGIFFFLLPQALWTWALWLSSKHRRPCIYFTLLESRPLPPSP